MNRVRFIVVGMQRSGTTVTHVGLEDRPNVSMSDHEVDASPFFTKGLSRAGSVVLADRGGCPVRVFPVT